MDCFVRLPLVFHCSDDDADLQRRSEALALVREGRRIWGQR